MPPSSGFKRPMVSSRFFNWASSRANSPSRVSGEISGSRGSSSLKPPTGHDRRAAFSFTPALSEAVSGGPPKGLGGGALDRTGSPLPPWSDQTTGAPRLADFLGGCFGLGMPWGSLNRH